MKSLLARALKQTEAGIALFLSLLLNHVKLSACSHTRTSKGYTYILRRGYIQRIYAQRYFVIFPPRNFHAFPAAAVIGPG